MSLFGALTYAEVAGLLADTGGDYAYYKRIYNRFIAFQFGWSTFAVIESAAIASLAYVFAQSLNSVVHLPPMLGSVAQWHISDFYPFENFNIKFAAIGLIILLTWINTRGLRTGAWLGTFILALVFTGIFIIIAFGLTSPEANPSMAFSMKTTHNQSVNLSTMFSAMLSAFFAYQGWAAVGYIGGEARDANRIIPRGITIGIFIVIALYLIVNVSYLSLLPVEKLEAINVSGNGVAAIEAVKVFWGRNGELFIGILIVITTMSCNHATIVATSRIYYAMAREGLFFKSAARLNRHLAPANSLIIQCTWSCLLVFSGSFDRLSDMMIFVVFVFYGATATGVFILRKRMPDAPGHLRSGVTRLFRQSS